MTRRIWLRRTLVVTGVLALGGIGWAAASSERPDCPGKIICPITGKLVCKDRCPLNGQNNAAQATTEVPPCCKKGS